MLNKDDTSEDNHRNCFFDSYNVKDQIGHHEWNLYNLQTCSGEFVPAESVGNVNIWLSAKLAYCLCHQLEKNRRPKAAAASNEAGVWRFGSHLVEERIAMYLHVELVHVLSRKRLGQ